jgi:hypothetical protein
MNYNTLQELVKLKKIKENKKKSTSNDPSLNTTRSSSLDLGFDELQVHIDQILIPAQKSQQREVMPNGIATWQVRIKWKCEMSR